MPKLIMLYDWALWTCVRSSVQCGRKSVTDRPYSRHRIDTDVKWIKPKPRAHIGTSQRQFCTVHTVHIRTINRQRRGTTTNWKTGRNHSSCTLHGIGYSTWRGAVGHHPVHGATTTWPLCTEPPTIIVHKSLGFFGSDKKTLSTGDMHTNV